MSEENKDIEQTNGQKDIGDVADSLGVVFDKPKKKISLSSFVFSAIALILAAVMTTYACCSAFYKKKYAVEQLEGLNIGTTYDGYDALTLIDAIFKTYGYYDDIDDEQVANYVLKAYVAATGDKHAYYYTDQEYKEMMSANQGEGEGIGVNVILSEIPYEGQMISVLEIIAVSPDSPAEEAGLLIGDLVAWVNDGGEKSVTELGFYGATDKLKGAVGTKAEFSILRPRSDGTYEKKAFSIERKNVTYRSVKSMVSEADASVGILKISSFDITTPSQLSEEMDALIASGCRKFVFDLRHNPGGDLNSIRAALSYFLNEGDLIISTVDKTGAKEEIKAEPVVYTDPQYTPCNVSKSDIGKYRGYEFAVLCNEGTASAAELFTAAMRDYGLAEIVGEQTYGKGSMQRTYPLAMFGCGGALKVTIRLYFPPCGVGYDGVGIVPDRVVELSEAAKQYSIYKLPQSLDDQLIAAIGALNQ
ncbi:MAG: hypothetical protein J6V42_01240 [Clostridia bacterium]|nr:hypothetical protein [Clostridia bacterium]